MEAVKGVAEEVAAIDTQSNGWPVYKLGEVEEEQVQGEEVEEEG